MSRKPRTASSTKSGKSKRKIRSAIPEPFQVVSSVTTSGGAAKVEVPMLVLYGQWLELPRRLRIHAVPS